MCSVRGVISPTIIVSLGKMYSPPRLGYVSATDPVQMTKNMIMSNDVEGLKTMGSIHDMDDLALACDLTVNEDGTENNSYLGMVKYMLGEVVIDDEVRVSEAYRRFMVIMQSISRECMRLLLLDPRIGDHLLVQDGILLSHLSHTPLLLSMAMGHIESNPKIYDTPYDVVDEAYISMLADNMSGVINGGFIYPVSRVYDVTMMMRYGFFPTSINWDSRPLSQYIFGLDHESIEFWESYDPSMEGIGDRLVRLAYEPRWSYRPVSYHISNGQKRGISLPLIMRHQSGVYSDSNRPITDMSIFKTRNNNRIRMEDLSPVFPGTLSMDDKHHLSPVFPGTLSMDDKHQLSPVFPGTLSMDDKHQLSIDDRLPYMYQFTIGDIEYYGYPVTRYATGMSKGLFYNKDANKTESQKEYCGTFYYLQPGSLTLLSFRAGRSRSFFNKLSAMLHFDRNHPSVKELIDTYYNEYPYLRMYNEGKLPPDLMMTPNEVIGLPEAPIYDAWSDDRVNTLPQRRSYAGPYLGLYAMEDLFDQPICVEASKSGIDVMLLTNMVGSFQVVSEVLDTRSRTDSFSSLVYIIPSLKRKTEEVGGVDVKRTRV
jgi:hypothetical protein